MNTNRRQTFSYLAPVNPVKPYNSPYVQTAQRITGKGTDYARNKMEWMNNNFGRAEDPLTRSKANWLKQKAGLNIVK